MLSKGFVFMASQKLLVLPLSMLLLTSCVGPAGRLVRYPNNDRGGLSSPHDDRDAEQEYDQGCEVAFLLRKIH